MFICEKEIFYLQHVVLCSELVVSDLPQYCLSVLADCDVYSVFEELFPVGKVEKYTLTTSYTKDR